MKSQITLLKYLSRKLNIIIIGIKFEPSESVNQHLTYVAEAFNIFEYLLSYRSEN